MHLLICFFVVCMHECLLQQDALRGDQKTTCGVGFFLLPSGLGGVELQSPSLAVSAFTHRATLQSL